VFPQHHECYILLARKNEQHGVSMSEAEQVFFNMPLLVLPDPGHSDAESRFHALGKTIDGRRLHITFTLRRDGELIRVICSARHAPKGAGQL